MPHESHGWNPIPIAYSIWQDSAGYIRVKNHATGGKDWYGTDFSTVVNKVASQMLTPGRNWKERIYIQKTPSQPYILNSTITLPSFTSFDFSEAILKLGNNAGVPAFNNLTQQNGTSLVSDSDIDVIIGQYDGNRVNQTQNIDFTAFARVNRMYFGGGNSMANVHDVPSRSYEFNDCKNVGIDRIVFTNGGFVSGGTVTNTNAPQVKCSAKDVYNVWVTNCSFVDSGGDGPSFTGQDPYTQSVSWYLGSSATGWKFNSGGPGTGSPAIQVSGPVSGSYAGNTFNKFLVGDDVIIGRGTPNEEVCNITSIDSNNHLLYVSTYQNNNSQYSQETLVPGLGNNHNVGEIVEDPPGVHDCGFDTCQAIRHGGYGFKTENFIYRITFNNLYMEGFGPRYDYWQFGFTEGQGQAGLHVSGSNNKVFNCTIRNYAQDGLHDLGDGNAGGGAVAELWNTGDVINNIIVDNCGWSGFLTNKSHTSVTNVRMRNVCQDTTANPNVFRYALAFKGQTGTAAANVTLKNITVISDKWAIAQPLGFFGRQAANQTGPIIVDGGIWQMANGAAPVDVWNTNLGVYDSVTNIVGRNPRGFLTTPINPTFGTVGENGTSGAWVSGQTYTCYGVPIDIYISGGDSSATVAINGTPVPFNSNVTVYTLQVRDTITVTWNNVAPTFLVKGY